MLPSNILFFSSFISILLYVIESFYWSLGLYYSSSLSSYNLSYIFWSHSSIPSNLLALPPDPSVLSSDPSTRSSDHSALSSDPSAQSSEPLPICWSLSSIFWSLGSIFWSAIWCLRSIPYESLSSIFWSPTQSSYLSALSSEPSTRSSYLSAYNLMTQLHIFWILKFYLLIPQLYLLIPQLYLLIPQLCLLIPYLYCIYWSLSSIFWSLSFIFWSLRSIVCSVCLSVLFSSDLYTLLLVPQLSRLRSNFFFWISRYIYLWIFQRCCHFPQLPLLWSQQSWVILGFAFSSLNTASALLRTPELNSMITRIFLFTKICPQLFSSNFWSKASVFWSLSCSSDSTSSFFDLFPDTWALSSDQLYYLSTPVVFLHDQFSLHRGSEEQVSLDILTENIRMMESAERRVVLAKEEYTLKDDEVREYIDPRWGGGKLYSVHRRRNYEDTHP